MFFGKCHVTHEPRKESLDGIGRSSVSPSIQVINEILEYLLIPIDLLQPLYNLFSVFLGDIPQNGPGAMYLTTSARMRRGRRLSCHWRDIFPQKWRDTFPHLIS